LHPKEYAALIVGFLDKALPVGPSSSGGTLWSDGENTNPVRDPNH
jgi:hypothetical protein